LACERGPKKALAGQPDLAIEHSEVALRLSPRARVGSTLTTIGAAHFFARRFEQAVPKLILAIQDDPSRLTPYRYLAASYAHLGRLDDAGKTIERARALTQVLIPDATYLRNLQDRELYLSGLRLAAGQET
jgi:adenylate cyclase